MTLTPVSVALGQRRRTSPCPSVNFARATFSGQERITVTAGVANKGADAATNVPVTLEIDGRQMETLPANVGAQRGGVGGVRAVHARRAGGARHRAKPAPIRSPADNTFHFVLTPSQSVSVLVDRQRRPRATRASILSKALGIGTTPAFQVEIVPAARVTPTMLDKRSVVILNDAMLPPGPPAAC